MRVIRRQLLVDPTQIEKTVDLPHQMIGWDHLVQIKRIKELTLSVLPPTHHAPLPPMTLSNQRNHGSRVVSTRVLQHNPRKRTSADAAQVRFVPNSDFSAKNGYEATFRLARSFLVRQSMRFRE